MRGSAVYVKHKQGDTGKLMIHEMPDRVRHDTRNVGTRYRIFRRLSRRRLKILTTKAPFPTPNGKYFPYQTLWRRDSACSIFNDQPRHLSYRLNKSEETF